MNRSYCRRCNGGNEKWLYVAINFYVQFLGRKYFASARCLGWREVEWSRGRYANRSPLASKVTLEALMELPEVRCYDIRMALWMAAYGCCPEWLIYELWLRAGGTLMWVWMDQFCIMAVVTLHNIVITVWFLTSIMLACLIFLAIICKFVLTMRSILH